MVAEEEEEDQCQQKSQTYREDWMRSERIEISEKQEELWPWCCPVQLAMDDLIGCILSRDRDKEVKAPHDTSEETAKVVTPN